MMQSILYRAGHTENITADAWLGLVQTGSYRGVIFDCDGTLVDSSEAHFDAFQVAVRAQGYEMERAWYEARTGLDRVSILDGFAQLVVGPFDAAAVAQDSIEVFIAGSAAVMPIAQTVQLVKGLQGLHRLAVGTNSERDVAAASLTATGLLGFFDHVVTISDGVPPKPAPDIFMRAAGLLKAEFSQTLVFEDSNEGVQAALTAGMDVVQLLPS